MDLTRPQPPEQTPPGQLGYVTKAPIAAGAPFSVTVPGFSGQHFYEITRWQSRGSTIPEEGDEVLVVVDDHQEPWVSAWWPANGDDPVVGEPGPEGPEGPAGPAGPAGPEGPQGKEGKEGKQGLQGVEGKQGPEGKQGVEGKAGVEGPQGKEGKEGAAGADGRWASLRYVYKTNTEKTNPGAGALKLDKTGGSLPEATSLRISETDGDGGAIAGYLALWDNSTSTPRGFIIMRKIGTPATFAVFAVTAALVDEGTWDALVVEHVASGGAFANNDPVSVEFYMAGEKGDKGFKGDKGDPGPGAPFATWSELVEEYATWASLTE